MYNTYITFANIVQKKRHLRKYVSIFGDYLLSAVATSIAQATVQPDDRLSIT